MALSAQHVTDMATQAIAVGQEAASLYYKAKQILQHNTDQGIDWAGEPVPQYITDALGVNGNIDGKKCTPAQVSTLMYALSQLVAWGDAGHLGTIHVVQ
jgi:hypothetical protein